MKDPNVAAKCGKSVHEFCIKNPDKRREIELNRLKALYNTDYKHKISKTLKGRYCGKDNPNYGNYWNEVQRNKQSKKMKGRYVGENNPNYGNKWDEERRKKLSDVLKKIRPQIGINNPMFGKKRITNGIINTVINKDDILPKGFRYGMIRK